MGKAKVSDKKAIALKVKPGKKNDPKTKNKVTGFKITKKGKNDAETVDLIKQIKNSTSKKAEKKNKAAEVTVADTKPKVDKQKKKKEKKTSIAEETSETTVKEPVTFENILPAGKTSILVQSLIDATKGEVEKKKDILGSNYKYRIQIQAIKIPKCPERVARISLPHSLLTPEDDVCLIVRDEQRGKKVDFEPTKQKWEDLLKENEIECIKTVMPFNQLKNEYPAFEMKKKLANSYEVFLVDGSICGNTFAFMGQSFTKQRKNPIPIQLGKSLEKKSLKETIGSALKKVQYRQTASGDITTIDFANDSMKKSEIVENLEGLIKELKGQFPGGYENIRSISLRPAFASAITVPVYYNFKDSKTLEVPVIVGPKTKRLKATQEIVNDALSKIQLVGSGKVVKKTAIEDAQQKPIKTKLATIVKKKKSAEEIKMQKKMKKINKRGKKRDMEKEQQKIRQKHETPFGSETVLLNKTADSDNNEAVEEVTEKIVAKPAVKAVKNKKNIEKKTAVKAGKVTKKKIEKVVKVTKPVVVEVAKKVVEKKPVEKKTKLGKSDNKEAAKAGKIFKKSKLIKS